MDSAKLNYTSQYTPATILKNQDRQVFFSVSAMSSHLAPNSFDLARNFGPLAVPQLTDPPYPYPRLSHTVSSPDHHPGPFPQSQEAPLTDVTTYIYDAGSSSYPQPSQSSYQPNVNADLSAHAVSLSLNSSLGLAIQTPATAFSLVPSDYNAVRRYHQDQSRQHAQVLQQLTRSRDPRRHSSTEHANGFEITPTGRRAEFYHAASSIPMSNIQLHQPRPPEHAGHHLQQSKSFDQYQYPYYHNQDLGYADNCRSEQLDGSATHLTTQGIGIYESAQQQSSFPIPTKTVRISSPSTTNSTIVLESGMYAMPHSNATRSIPQPSTDSFEETTRTSKVHPTAGVPDVAPITPPPPALTNGTVHEDAPSGIAEEGSNLIEIESDDEETSELILLKEDGGSENIPSNHSGTNAKRRDRRQSEGSGATGRRTGDSKTDPIIKDGLSPPSKKRKKSKMHECQVCHKHFPRPSGLKTHMNTHNNERPYSCPFPGCNRSFGVRSNAKRHLRTHGVVPPQNTGTQPYVVDFSTPMVLEDGRLGLNGEGSCNEDDDRPEGTPHSQRPGRPGRGRGRQFKLRWMPPSSSTKSGMVKGKGKKKSTDSPSVEIQDPGDVKPSFSRSPSQRNVSHSEEDQEEEDADADADGNTDGEADTEMDFGDDGDYQDEEESEGEEDVDRSEEEFGASTAMRAGVARFNPSHSQASSSRTSLSSSLSVSATGSTSATSLPLSASSSSVTSVSPIRAEYFVDSGT